MKKIFLMLMVSIMLGGCATLGNKESISQVQITTSKVNLINNVVPADTFEALSKQIVSETYNKLRLKGINPSTSNNVNTVILMIDYEYLEPDTLPMPFGRASVYSMKGKIKLIDPKTKREIYTDSFDETEDKLSNFVNSISKDVTKKVANFIDN